MKGGVRYRYYISRASAQMAPGSAAAAVRLPASEIEEAVLKGLVRKSQVTAACEAGNTARPGSGADDAAAGGLNALLALVERVHIRAGAIEIELGDEATGSGHDKIIVVPWSKPPTRMQREVIPPANGHLEDPRAMSSDTRSRVLSAIAVARRWMADLAADTIESIDALATREGRSARSVTKLLSLAFLAPDLVKAIVDNRMPRGVGLTTLMDLPSVWAEQRRALGLQT